MPAAENTHEENSADQHPQADSTNEYHSSGDPVEKISNLNEEEVDENMLQPVIIEQPQATDSPLQTDEMEVHHHPDLHHRKKHWKEYFLEFLMIFLAVTLGFFAENIREHIVEEDRARQYARSLVHDLEKDTAMVQIDIRNIQYFRTRIDSLTSFLRNKKIENITNEDLYAFTYFIALYRPYSWSRATLEQITSSGSLRYFKNDSIIMKISAYEAVTKHLDNDFIGDDARSDQISQKRNRIADFNYPFQPSSVRDTALRAMFNKAKEDRNFPGLNLLTNNINDIKSLANDYLLIRWHFTNRESELKNLIEDASQLIAMLRNEYHLQ